MGVRSLLIDFSFLFLFLTARAQEACAWGQSLPAGDDAPADGPPLQSLCGRADAPAEPERELEDVSVSLLHVTHVLQKARERQPAARGASPLLVAARPLAWLHFPKTGTSFVNALIKLPGVCRPGSNTFSSYGDIEFVTAGLFISELHCTGIYHVEKVWGHRSFMGSPSSYSSSYLGHSVAMFRQPEQRILSSLHDMKAEDHLDSFVHFNQGTYVKMLTRTVDQGWAEPSQNAEKKPQMRPVPTADEAALAVKRMREAFAFVGITEQWDLSMCLLHAMFGGRCLASDFANANPGEPGQGLRVYNTSELRGFVDVFDGPVYAEALQVFNERLREFNVSTSSCQPCFEEARLD